MRNKIALSLIRLAIKSEKNNLFKLSDKFTKIAQDYSQYEELQKGQDLESGKAYLVPTDDNSIFDEVAQKGTPAKANVGGESVWVTHGTEDGFFLLPEEKQAEFKSANPEFENNSTLSEQDSASGIKAMMNGNNVWVNEEGWKKYVGQYWIGCFDGKRKGFGQYATSKDEIGVGTIDTPEGKKTFLKAGF